MNLPNTVSYPSSTELCCCCQSGKYNTAKCVKQNRKSRNSLRKSAPDGFVHWASHKLTLRKRSTSRRLINFLRKHYIEGADSETGASIGNMLRKTIQKAGEIPVLTRCCFCFPLNTGLKAFAYFNLILNLVTSIIMLLYIATVRGSSQMEEVQAELPRRIFALCAKVVEFCMTVTFILALQRKHVMLMKVYLAFEVIYSIIGTVYNLAYLSAETAGEFFLELFEFRSSMVQVYLVILVWSLIVKLERDGKVRYTREKDTVV